MHESINQHIYYNSKLMKYSCDAFCEDLTAGYFTSWRQMLLWLLCNCVCLIVCLCVHSLVPRPTYSVYHSTIHNVCTRRKSNLRRLKEHLVNTVCITLNNTHLTIYIWIHVHDKHILWLCCIMCQYSKLISGRQHSFAITISSECTIAWYEVKHSCCLWLLISLWLYMYMDSEFHLKLWWFYACNYDVVCVSTLHSCTYM